QALDTEVFDEPHSAHVGRQVIDLASALADPPAIGLLAHVQAQALDAWDALIPVRQRFSVYGSDPRESTLMEVAGQGSGDEAAGSRDDNQVALIALGEG